MPKATRIIAAVLAVLVIAACQPSTAPEPDTDAFGRVIPTQAVNSGTAPTPLQDRYQGMAKCISAVQWYTASHISAPYRFRGELAQPTIGDIKFGSPIVTYSGGNLEIRNDLGQWHRHTFACYYDNHAEQVSRVEIRTAQGTPRPSARQTKQTNRH